MAILRPLFSLLAVLVFVVSGPIPCHSADLPTHEDKATDKAQMHQIWEALMKYKKDKGKLPDALSDLVPAYLPDPAVLISPAETRTGRRGNNGFDDPKLKCSYCYEFSGIRFNNNKSFREIKEEQIEEFGPVVPILRCFSYDVIINVAYSGDIYETALMWETSPEAKELIKKLGTGPGPKKGVFTTLTVHDDKGSPIPDAEVQLTKRRGDGLPLPDRTLKTDSKGIVQVPLGRDEKAIHLVTVKALKAGHFAASEAWNRQNYQKERSITMASAVAIGGLVKMKNGSPLANANVLIKLLSANSPEDGLVMTTTDAAGHWEQDGLPSNFAEMTLTVKCEGVRPGQFNTSKEPGLISRDALIAKNAELVVSPAPMISGTIIDKDGNPVPNAEVYLRPAVLKSIKSEEISEFPNQAARPAEPPIKTNHKGMFSSSWPDDESVVVTVFAQDYAPAQQVVSVSSEMSPANIPLESGKTVSGQLSDYEGKPVDGAEVYLFMLGQNGVPVRKQITTTNGEGQFSWDHAPNRPMTLLFLRNGYEGTLKDFRTITPPKTPIMLTKQEKK
ncbi:hypothetical protein ACXR0O_04160 [Verrucomicrobiota bacterium sgz303538]